MSLPEVLVSKKRIPCISLSVNQTILPLSNATMEVMREDVLPIRTFVKINTPNGITEIYRTRQPQESHSGQTATIQLDHAVCEIGDYLVQGYYNEEMTVRAAFQTLFSHYRGVWWQLGSFSASDTVILDCDYGNILEAMIGVLEQSPNYVMTFDFNTTPWTLGLAAKTNTVTAEGRLSRNVASDAVKRDDKDLCTRVYVKGLPVSTPEGEEPDPKAIGYMEADTIGTYGVVERETGDNDLTAEQATKIATTYLAAHKHPKLSVEMDCEDLTKYTGESLDSFVCGKKFRLCVPEDGTIIEDYVTKVSFTDIISSNHANIIIGDDLDATLNFLQKQASAAKAAGRRARKTDDRFQEVYSEILQLDDMIHSAVWTANSELYSYIDQTATYIYSHVGDVENDLYSAIDQTASMIHSAVWTANSVVFSYIDQTATYISNHVEDINNDLHTEILQTQSMIHSAVWTANSELVSYIDQTATYILSVVEDTANDLGSAILQTASQIRAEVHAADSLLYSYVDQTATYILSVVSDTANDLGTAILQTASEIRSEAHASESELYSYVDQTATYIESVVADTANDLGSAILQTASEIRSEVHASNSELYSYVDQTATYIESVVADTANDLGSAILQTASEIRAEVHAADSSLYSYVDQTATSINQVVANTASGLQSSINQQADQIGLVVQGTGSNAHIKAAAITASINAQSGQSKVSLSADVIDIDGVVTALGSKDIGCGSLTVEGFSEFYKTVEIGQGIEFDAGTGINGKDITNFIASASVSGNTLTLYPVDGEPITFSKAASTKVSGSWSGGVLTVSADENGESSYIRSFSVGTVNWQADKKAAYVYGNVIKTSGGSTYVDEADAFSLYVPTTESYNEGFAKGRNFYLYSQGWSSGKLTIGAKDTASGDVISGKSIDRTVTGGTPSWDGTTVTVPIRAYYGITPPTYENTGASVSVNVAGKLQTKTISSNGNNITPDSDYIGFSSVTVAVNPVVGSTFVKSGSTYYVSATKDGTEVTTARKQIVLARSGTTVQIEDGQGTARANTPTYTIPLTTQTISSNGTYSPTSSYVGFSSVTVSVSDPVVGSTFVKDGSTYYVSATKDGTEVTTARKQIALARSGTTVQIEDGHGTVRSNTPTYTIPLQDKTGTNKITANGTYSPTSSYVGFSSVEIDVAGADPVIGSTFVNSGSTYYVSATKDGTEVTTARKQIALAVSGSNVVVQDGQGTTRSNTPSLALSLDTGTLSSGLRTVKIKAGGSATSITATISDYGDGWSGCYSDIGLNYSSNQTINPGSSITVYPAAKPTPSGSHASITTKGITVTASSVTVNVNQGSWTKKILSSGRAYVTYSPSAGSGSSVTLYLNMSVGTAGSDGTGSVLVNYSNASSGDMETVKSLPVTMTAGSWSGNNCVITAKLSTATLCTLTVTAPGSSTPTLSGNWSSGTLTVSSSPAAQANYVRSLSAGEVSWSNNVATIPINAKYGNSGQYSESTGWSVTVNASTIYAQGAADGKALCNFIQPNLSARYGNNYSGTIYTSGSSGSWVRNVTGTATTGIEIKMSENGANASSSNLTEIPSDGITANGNYSFMSGYAGIRYLKVAVPSANYSVSFYDTGRIASSQINSIISGWNATHISGVKDSAYQEYRYIRFKVDGKQRCFYFS